VLVFFVLAGNSFRCFVPMVLIVQLQLCGCVSFLVVVGNSPQNENTFLQKNLIGLLYYDPIADVCIYKTKLSFTLYLSILYFSCTAQICTLKLKSEYYLRIHRKLCQKCKHRQSHFDFLKNAYPVSLFLRNNLLVKQFQHSICISSIKT
jgi:hypothetical protein